MYEVNYTCIIAILLNQTKVNRKKEVIMTTSNKGLDCLTNSPHHYYRKCMENSV